MQSGYIAIVRAAKACTLYKRDLLDNQRAAAVKEKFFAINHILRGKTDVLPLPLSYIDNVSHWNVKTKVWKAWALVILSKTQVWNNHISSFNHQLYRNHIKIWKNHILIFNHQICKRHIKIWKYDESILQINTKVWKNHILCSNHELCKIHIKIWKNHI